MIKILHHISFQCHVSMLTLFTPLKQISKMGVKLSWILKQFITRPRNELLRECAWSTVQKVGINALVLIPSIFFFFLPEMACAETWICTSYHVSFSKQTVQIILLPGMGSYLSGRTRAHIYTNRSSLFYVIIEADQLNYPQCQGLEILPAALSSFHCFPLLFLSKHINPYEVAFQTGLSSSLWRKENISM